MGGACSTHERREIHIFWFENLNEREHLEGLGVDGRIIQNGS